MASNPADYAIQADPARLEHTFSRLERILNDHDEILECLTGHLFPDGDIYIYAREPGDAQIATTKTTLYHGTHRERSTSANHFVAKTAYFGSMSTLSAHKAQPLSGTLPRCLGGMTTEMLLVSRRCYELAQPYLYRRKFNFHCCPAGVTQFLCD